MTVRHFSENFFEGTVTDYQKASVLVEANDWGAWRLNFAVADVAQRLSEMKAKYIRSIPEWLDGIPPGWSARMVKALGVCDKHVKDIVEMLAWLLFDWSSEKDETARRRQVENLLRESGADEAAHAKLKKFATASLEGPHQQDALWLLESIVWDPDGGL